MKVPLTVNDFLRRAELVYPDRVAIVDEPDQPAESWGTITYREMAERARAMAAGLDALGIGVGERVAMVSHNSARLLTAFFGVSGSGRILVPINFRLVAEEVKYIVEHSGARVLLVDPELADALADVECEHKLIIGAEADAVLMQFGVEPRAVGRPTRTPPPRSTTRPAPPPDPRACSSRTATSGSTPSIFGWHMGVNDRDVYLHTLPLFHCNGWGMPYAVTGMGAEHVVLRKIDGAEILRRVEEHGVTLMCGAPAVLNMVLDAAATWEAETVPGPGRDRVRIVVAGAPPPTRTIERVRDRARLGVHPDLRPHRDHAAAHHEPRPGGVRRPHPGRAGREAQPGRRAGARVHDGGQRRRRDAGPRQHRDRRLLGAARRDRRGDPRRLVPHRRRRHHRRRRLPDDLRPQEGRDHHRRRERVVDRGRGRHLPAPRGRRGRRDRHPRREVGRARHGARGDGAGQCRSPRPT